jgi:diadenosine tetraphosphatase ApaH/serine/threonine PP2A family protein phosphatase
MILALFSDIHGNREAFQACLIDAASRGAEQYVFLGDLVGYGADPAYVVETVARFAAKGAIVVKGNHDVAVLSPLRDMNGPARQAIEWTKEHLSADEKAFLAALPLSASLGELLFVHGDASDPAGWIYVMGPLEAERSMRATQHRVTFSGHVHRPQLARMPLKAASDLGSTRSAIPVTRLPNLLERDMKWHAVLGSVGQPRDENTDAAYALYDDTTAALTFMRVSYDIAKAADKIRSGGLPPVLADRLFLGR